MVGIAQAFGAPARWSLVPQVVPDELLLSAVTWNSSSWQLASMVGPAVGGLVVAQMGLPAAQIRAVERLAGTMIGELDERQDLGEWHVQSRQVGAAQAPHAARLQHPRHRLDAEARNAQQQLLRRAVEVDREAVAVGGATVRD